MMVVLVESWEAPRVVNGRAEGSAASSDPQPSSPTIASISSALDATNTYDQIAAQYAAAAGRTLTPTEIGLKYIQEIFHDSLGQKRYSVTSRPVSPI